ncbi:hypothetical protein ACH5RR_024024 [Cinchona calisaya]|uniref:Digalactosyldiacylglycerol synthase 2, chloroplastic n=1 Tax=Cinchona calisaya TaxID=153742 RepID=A0ABD2ZCA7_9GENT
MIPDTSTCVKTICQTDMIMMTQNPGGKERSEKEILALATAAGFRGMRIDCFGFDSSELADTSSKDEGFSSYDSDFLDSSKEEEAFIIDLDSKTNKEAGEVSRRKKSRSTTQFSNMVIRLSAATQELPRSTICNVHGVNPKFLEIGNKKKAQQQNGEKAFTKGAYYIGKMVWSKGYKELLKLLRDHQKELAGLEVDLYGNGEDSAAVQEAAKKLALAVMVHPGRDHADPLFLDYKVFLNPSTTDVVCTTTAEALAMGKIVVYVNHPLNEFFKQFPNCRTYDNAKGFVEATNKALNDEPSPLTDDQLHKLSWEAATERFLKLPIWMLCPQRS